MKRIGVQIDFAGGYGRAALRGLMQYANLQSDWEFVMPPMYSLLRQQRRSQQLPPNDGTVAMIHSPSSLESYRRAGVPLVNIARTMSAAQLNQHRMHTVVPDDEAIGRLAFDYFFERRFRAFGFCGHPTASWSKLRRDAFVQACRAQGFPCTVISAIDQVPAEWIRSLPRPCAVLAGNDRYAWSAINQCRELAIAVPEEIAVLGVDNDTLLTEMVRPTLSSIDSGGERVGFDAGQMLDALLAGKRIAKRLVLVAPTGVVTRHSTDVLSIEDEVVAQAAKFIREHASEPVGVQDVLDDVMMSRRNLERRFQRVMQRSLHAEIIRVHLDRATRLLRETRFDIPTVATQSGFASHVRFSTVFREQIGQTPTAYRNRFRVSI